MARTALKDTMPIKKQAPSVSDTDLEIARRLKSTYEDKKTPLRLSQSIVAKQLGISQSLCSNYLNGVYSVNLPTLLRFAKVLQVDPHDLDPNLERRFKLMPLTTRTRLTVAGTISGSPRVTAHYRDFRGSQMQETYWAIEVDSPLMQPVLQPGAHLIVDPRSAPQQGDIVVQYKATGYWIPYHLIQRHKDGSLDVEAWQLPTMSRRHHIQHPEFFPESALRIREDDYSACMALIGTQADLAA